jgi:single-strand DNA-binding protein
MAGYMQLIIVGNVGKEPELKYTASGLPVCNFSVAVNTVTGSGEQRQEKVQWVRVAAWRDLAERCNQYIRKGSQVMVIGTVEAKGYAGQDGKPQASLELNAREVRFLGGKPEGSEQEPERSAYEEMPF